MKLGATIAAYTMVSNHAITRAVTKALFWFAPPPYPTQVVKHLDQALDFIGQRMPDFDREKFLKEYRHASGVADLRMKLRAAR